MLQHLMHMKVAERIHWHHLCKTLVINLQNYFFIFHFGFLFFDFRFVNVFSLNLGNQLKQINTHIQPLCLKAYIFLFSFFLNYQKISRYVRRSSSATGKVDQIRGFTAEGICPIILLEIKR